MTDRATLATLQTRPPEWFPAMIALDIDGTLLDHDERISERVRSAVRATVAAGTHVTVATGRSLHSTLPVLDRLGLLSGWAVCSNGSVVLRLDQDLPAGFEVTDVVTFDPAPALRLLRTRLPAAVYALETATGEYLITAPFPPGELEGSFVRVTGFDELLEQPACRVVVRSPEHTSSDFLALTRQIGLHGVNYAVGWTAWLDLAPDGVSKASALEVIRARLGADPGATLAVGDGRNDLEMFEWAARSVAMGNASPDVREAADRVAGDIAVDGLAEVLEEYLRTG